MPPADGGAPTAGDQHLAEDIAATVYTKLGISTGLIVNSPDGRPVRLIAGRPIAEWI